MIRILLIDNEKIEAKLINFALRKTLGAGFTLDFALTIERAVECMKTHEYDLILLDNMLPKGLTAKHMLPGILPHRRQAEIVVVSSIIDRPVLEAQMGEHVDDFVDKFYIKEYFKKKYGAGSAPAIKS